MEREMNREPKGGADLQKMYPGLVKKSANCLNTMNGTNNNASL